jgi:transposase-like protein
MKERKQFVREHPRGEHSVSELCRRFGIRRKTGHKWLGRFYAESGADPNVLEDRSRRPHSHPCAVPTWLEVAIVQARRQRPRWGPKKLRAVLARSNPEVELPAQQGAFDRFRAETSHERPHEALGQVPPADFYEPSRRPLPFPSGDETSLTPRHSKPFGRTRQESYAGVDERSSSAPVFVTSFSVSIPSTPTPGRSPSDPSSWVASNDLPEVASVSASFAAHECHP